MTETKINKTSRKLETREKDARKRGWVPPSNLEAPEPPEGFHHRWVRAEYRGMADEKNIIFLIFLTLQNSKTFNVPRTLTFIVMLV